MLIQNVGTKYICKFHVNHLSKLTKHFNQDQHFKQDDENIDDIMRCPICPKEDKKASNLFTHVKTEHLKLKKKCQECNKLYPIGRRYLCHLNKMHGSNKSDETLYCELCDYSTNLKDLLKKHVRIRHEREKKHLCDQCHLRFEFPNELKNHCEKVHSKIKDHKFSCDLCDKSFKYKSQLTDHIERNEGKSSCGTKGQLISKCSFGVFKSTKTPRSVLEPI